MTRLERRIAHYNDPAYDSLRTRAGRRRVVVEGVLLAIAVTAITVLFTALLQGYLNLGLSIPASIGIWWLWVYRLRLSTRGLTDLPPEVLDERQRTARARAFERSYRVLVVGFLLLPFLAIVDGLIGLEPIVYFVAGLIGILVALATPPLVLALTEPGEELATDDGASLHGAR